MSRRAAETDFSKNHRILEALASGKYTVTAEGRVFNNRHRNTAERRELRYYRDKDGYLLVHLKGVGVCRLHRVVALAFLGPTPGFRHVNHKNGDIADNRAGNLEWGLPVETVAKAAARGLRHDQRGDGNNGRRLTAEQVGQIRSLLDMARYSQQKIADMFGVAQTTISAIARRVNWGGG